MKHVSYLTGIQKSKIAPVQTVKPYMGSRGIAPLILTTALDGGEWSISCPGRFTRGKYPGTLRIEGWACPGTGVDFSLCTKKSLALDEIQTPDRPARSLPLY